jgi:hypothetical protein
MKQTPGGGHGGQHADGDAGGGLTEDRHPRGIAAEVGDVVMDPLQARDLILKAVAAGLAYLNSSPRPPNKWFSTRPKSGQGRMAAGDSRRGATSAHSAPLWKIGACSRTKRATEAR